MCGWASLSGLLEQRKNENRTGNMAYKPAMSCFLSNSTNHNYAIDLMLVRQYLVDSIPECCFFFFPARTGILRLLHTKYKYNKCGCIDVLFICTCTHTFIIIITRPNQDTER